MVHGDKTVAPAGKFPPSPHPLLHQISQKREKKQRPTLVDTQAGRYIQTYLGRGTWATQVHTPLKPCASLGDLPKILEAHALQRLGAWESSCLAVGLGACHCRLCEDDPKHQQSKFCLHKGE